MQMRDDQHEQFARIAKELLDDVEALGIEQQRSTFRAHLIAALASASVLTITLRSHLEQMDRDIPPWEE